MMQALYFFVLASMLTAYAVLDGFDFGAGILHLFVAKTDEERRTVLGAIGPLWDGNEVWLIASGGVLVFAFPAAYAAAFSGLYLPLMMVLWLLIGRGLSVELRSKSDHPLWRAGFDGMFAFSSAMMAIVLGVALGNVLRGVPIESDGWFAEDLFSTSKHIGAIDLYTLLVGVFALVTLAAHGATFLVWKTTGALNDRSAALARKLWPAALILGLVVTAVTAGAHPRHFGSFGARPWLWPLPVLAFGAGAGALMSIRAKKELRAFLSSCAFVALLLLTTAGTIFPVMLRSTVDDRFTIDVYAGTPNASLTTGLVLLLPGLALAISYFTYVYRTAQGKVDPHEGHG